MIRNDNANASRRHFLGWSARMAALGAGAPFAINLAALGAASAQTASDYKALVCVFLFGGNDNHNTVIPYDAASYTAYQQARGVIARARNTLLPLTPLSSQGGRQFSLPPELQPLATLFDAGRAAIVANIGPLVRPTTRAQYQARSVPLPPKLFSHNDQQSVWQASVPEGAQYGWGGRIGDVLASANAKSTFTSISISGNAVWASGQSTQQYQVGPGGAIAVNALGNAGLFGSASAAQLLRRMVADPRSHILQNDHTRLMQRGLTANQDLRDAMAGMPALQTVFPESSLAAQLKMAARLIAVRDNIGAKRQVFFVSLGGFDNHAFLSNSHPPLLTQLAAALSAFDAALGELNVRTQVTTFTASDFGRTLVSNGDGSDHGWGAHHLVVGGAVRGRDIYGQFPIVAVGTNDDAGQGRFIPTTSVDQYAASFARWLGLSDAQLADVLPNLQYFSPTTLPLFV
jgi:uncharacterized protein (DUF1501 family)